MHFFRLFVLMIGFPVAANANDLRFVVNDYLHEPYWMSADEQQTTETGILFDIQATIAAQLHRKHVAVRYPRKRIMEAVARNEADATCFIRPDWVDNPNDYYWTSLLLATNEVWVLKSQIASKIKSVNELSSPTMGTITGYYYPEIQSKFDSKQWRRDDADSNLRNLEKLRRGRIDAAIMHESIFLYYVKNQPLIADAKLSTLDHQRVDVYCAMHKHNGALNQAVDEALKKLHREGMVLSILAKYQ